jgi:hypothetical protein
MRASHYVDPHTRGDRINVQNAHWNIQIEGLVRAYLDYRTRDNGDSMPSVSSIDDPQRNDADTLILQNIELVDIFSKHNISFRSEDFVQHYSRPKICITATPCLSQVSE